jgi:hypothetical protein
LRALGVEDAAPQLNSMVALVDPGVDRIVD